MDIKDKIELVTEIYVGRMERYLMQCPNATQEQKLEEAHRLHMYVESVTACLADIITYLDMRAQEIENTDFTDNENAWIEEVRRFVAIKDFLLYDKCSYIEDCKKAPSSFRRTSLKDKLPDDRPKDEIKKELLPV